MKNKLILIISFLLITSGLFISTSNAEFVVIVEPDDDITVVFDDENPEEPLAEEPPAEEPPAEEPPAEEPPAEEPPAEEPPAEEPPAEEPPAEEPPAEEPPAEEPPAEEPPAEEPPAEEPPAEEPPAEEPDGDSGNDYTDMTVDDNDSDMLYKKLIFDLSKQFSGDVKIIEGRLWFNRSKNNDDDYYDQARVWIRQIPKNKKGKNNKGKDKKKTPKGKEKNSEKFMMKKAWSKKHSLNYKKGGYEWLITEDLLAELEEGNFLFEVTIKYYNKEPLSKAVLIVTCEGNASGSDDTPINALVNVYPKTLNLKSHDKDIKAHIKLPGNYKVSDIDVSSIAITEIDGSIITPIPASSQKNSKNASTLKVQFPRSSLNNLLAEAENIMITISFELNSGIKFAGKTSINVINPGTNELLTENGGEINSHKKAKINVPRGALDELTEITIATDAEIEEEVVIDEDEEEDVDEDSDARDTALANQELETAGEGCNFGPKGTVFKKPVRITLFYDNVEGYDSSNLRIHYWNKELKTWEALQDSIVNTTDNSVSAEVEHFSLYQVLAPKVASFIDNPLPLPLPDNNLTDIPFELGEVYCYPNPVRGGATPTFHVEAGSAEEVMIRIFNVAGSIVDTIALDGSQVVYKDSLRVYEYNWNISGIASGIYIYTVTAEKEGQQPLRSTNKVGIIK